MTRPRVIVIGGGPGGASCAAVLASKGVDTLVLEKEVFPRHHIGESLQPAGLTLLEERLGLGAAIASKGFARKYGAVYVWGKTREPWGVLFDERLDGGGVDGLTEAQLLAGDYEMAYQVDRSLFDEIVLNEAVRRGAQLVTAKVSRVLRDGERVVGVATDTEELAADFVVDASGQACVLGHEFRLVRAVPGMEATATYAYFDGAGGFPGALGRHVQWVVTTPRGWVWFIPISASRTSVGVVLRDRRRLTDSEFATILADAHLPLEGAERVGELRFARDWSYALERRGGAGWVAIGDASGFVDPILSGGVDAALRAGVAAADAITESLADRCAEPLVRFARRQRVEYETYLDMARYWYSNNASMDGMFWRAHSATESGAQRTPLRAFVYLTSGHYRSDQRFKVFSEDQERSIFKALGVRPESVKIG